MSNYKLVEKLGSGTFATVYKAHAKVNPKLDIQVLAVVALDGSS